MNPDDVDLLIRRAAEVFDTDPAEAKRLVLAAVELAAEDPNQLTRCASMMINVGELALAKTYLLRVRELAPDGDFALAGSALHAVGRLRLEAGDTEGAEHCLRTAFERDPDIAGHGRVFAAFLAEQGRRDEALQVVARAEEHLPNDAALRELREWLEAND